MSADWTALNEIGGVPTTLASAGYRTRAVALQGLVHDAHMYLTQNLGTDFAPLVVVADATDWARYGDEAPPYGIPYSSGDGLKLVLPADPRKSVLIDAYAEFGSRESAERFADLIAVHELGHLHVREMGLDLPMGWLNEFMATYLSYCFLVTHRPEDAALWYGLSRAHAEGTRPKHRALEVLDELYFGVGADNYYWYQNALTLMVERVHASLGLDFALRMRSAGLGPDADSHTMLAAAEAVHPGFKAWAESLRGTTATTERQ